mmetsp:Transcript_19926/g.58827  ORF Transcript_19926/g.58827 Transcript_19926/m.58827 type:complete len:98 (-) Transcript_19926:903-1196(-)
MGMCAGLALTDLTGFMVTAIGYVRAWLVAAGVHGLGIRSFKIVAAISTPSEACCNGRHSDACVLDVRWHLSLDDFGDVLVSCTHLKVALAFVRTCQQ